MRNPCGICMEKDRCQGMNQPCRQKKIFEQLKKKICNRAVNQKSIWKEHDSKKYNGDNIFFYYCNA